MRDIAKKKAHDARRHKERMGDIRYRLRRVLFTIQARCHSGKGRKDWQYYGGKGIANYLTLDDLVFLWERDKAALMKRPTIDRKDSFDSYSLENCQFIEHADNLRKMIPTRKARAIGVSVADLRNGK